jgi:hypothetical protein
VTDTARTLASKFQPSVGILTDAKADQYLLAASLLRFRDFSLLAIIRNRGGCSHS